VESRDDVTRLELTGPEVHTGVAVASKSQGEALSRAEEVLAGAVLVLSPFAFPRSNILNIICFKYRDL
jgi:hypothetical protein